MTFQFPQIDSNQPRLLPDSYKQTKSDQTFEEKLKAEQSRLGLLFSPFSQLEALFNTQQNLSSSFQNLENDFNSYLTSQLSKENSTSSQTFSFSSFKFSTSHEPRIFESIPSQTFNRQFIQEILSKTNWLIPNLEAQPLFAQSVSAGKFLPSFDLQFLIDQIIEQVKLVKEIGKTELTLTLKPEELGEILLTLTSHFGIVTIQIQANPETKKLIESQRFELEQALKKAKIDFDKIEVQEVKKYA